MKKKKIIILSIAIIGLLLVVTGVTYSILSFKVEGNEVNIVKAGILKIDINENEPITLLEAYPISTEHGLEGDAYTFTVSNTGDIDAVYRIYLDDVQLDAGIERLSDSSIRYSLTKDGNYLTDTVADLLSQRENRLIDNGAIYPGETFNYELRMWIDEDVGNEEQGKAFKGKIRIEGEQLVNDTCFTVSNGTITGYSDTCSKDLVIPSKINGVTITGISTAAFQNKGLTSISIPSSVIEFGNYTFNNNQLPDDEAFIYARNSDGTIDETTLISYAGANRESVVIPEQVETITNLAFISCNIKEVIFPDNLKSINIQSFQGNLLTHLDLPSSLTYIGPAAFANNQLSDDEAFIYARKSDGSIDYTTLVSYGGAKRSDIVIPEGVVTLSTGAFSYHNNIANVIMPSTLKNIYSSAFLSAGLTSLDIPDNVTNISNGAFSRNKLPDAEAFIYKRNADGSEDRTTLISYGGANTTVTIPENVTIINSNAFDQSNIRTIILHENINTIGSNALRNSGVTKIVNKTGKAFNWGLIIDGVSGYNFVTGTVIRRSGNVEVVSE